MLNNISGIVLVKFIGKVISYKYSGITSDTRMKWESNNLLFFSEQNKQIHILAFTVFKILNENKMY